MPNTPSRRQPTARSPTFRKEGSESELVLLSAVNAGEFQRVYVNIRR